MNQFSIQNPKREIDGERRYTIKNKNSFSSTCLDQTRRKITKRNKINDMSSKMQFGVKIQ